MIEKDDWRLTGGEEELVGNRVFQKVKFPEFWRKAFEERNAFYQKVAKDAETFVKEQSRGEEFLEGDKVRSFWHEHCFFCWEKFTTDNPCECFCTQDYGVWICETCFNDFKDKFNFSISDENQ